MRTFGFITSALSILALNAVTVAAPVDNTLLLSHWDGDTGSAGRAADFAAGSTDPFWQGSDVVTTDAKFGAGSLDSSPANKFSYFTQDNFNTNAGTIEMWVQTDSWNSQTWAGLFNIYGTGVDIRMQRTNSDRIQVYMYDRSSEIWSLTSDPVALDSGWHHIAWTWNFAANKSAIYLDGVVLEDSPSLSGLTAIGYNGSMSNEMEIGTMTNSGSTFEGLIDEFRISDIDRYGGEDFTPQTEPFVIPEPATLGLAGFGGLLLLLRRR